MLFSERKPTRIPNFGYSSDHYYFVTICTHDKRCIFGRPGALNAYGKIAEAEIGQIRRQNIVVDQYVIMPNHVHMIIVIGCGVSERKKLDTVVGLYKSGVSRQIHKLEPQLSVWQRSFHDHVIRNQRAYEKIWSYIAYNPQKWEEDCFLWKLSSGKLVGGSRPSPTVVFCFSRRAALQLEQ